MIPFIETSPPSRNIITIDQNISLLNADHRDLIIRLDLPLGPVYHMAAFPLQMQPIVDGIKLLSTVPRKIGVIPVLYLGVAEFPPT